jgi:hypothetical protein
VLLALAACAPQVSSVPLGRGPLALAESEAVQRAESTQQHGGAPARKAPKSPKAPAPEAAAEPDSDPAAATDDVDEIVIEATPKGKAAPVFEGMYAGDDIAVFRITGLPEREQRDDKAKIRIDKTSDTAVTITLINSEDGSDLCSLAARVEGNSALIESAQPCFSDGGEGSLEAELTSGRAVLAGDRLRMDAEGTLSVALPDQDLDGELSYSFKGERQ